MDTEEDPVALRPNRVVPPQSSNLNTFTAPIADAVSNGGSRYCVREHCACELHLGVYVHGYIYMYTNIYLSRRKMARIVRPQRLTPWYIVYVSRCAYVVWDTCLLLGRPPPHLRVMDPWILILRIHRTTKNVSPREISRCFEQPCKRLLRASTPITNSERFIWQNHKTHKLKLAVLFFSHKYCSLSATKNNNINGNENLDLVRMKNIDL